MSQESLRAGRHDELVLYKEDGTLEIRQTEVRETYDGAERRGIYMAFLAPRELCPSVAVSRRVPHSASWIGYHGHGHDCLPRQFQRFNALQDGIHKPIRRFTWPG